MAHFGKKNSFFYIYLFYWFDQKKLFKTNPNIPQDLSLFKHDKKNKLSEYFCARFWDSHFFLLKR